MTSIEITPEERAELVKALTGALDPLATAVRSRRSGLSTARMWDADPVEVTLSVLAAWKVVDGEVRRLTALAAAAAGSYGANYEQLGAAWGMTRQGARKKWPEAVPRPTAARTGPSLELFGGHAELTQDQRSGGWSWTAEGADGTLGAAGDGTRYATKEEAAAHAGAFLREHVVTLP
ncbi:hypothetical protein SAMN05216371_7794 [Streptomyces sp. TLI_053]|uniref:hypothetical protein n=1 Tax=Streptomyces sp. TLI_053 TaxID=1855352 RepID=UPI00087B381B|nr:hypothetical protein [Streptomyces sp. TLI_053]SDT82982.1 hypothetical protein SAMN05216371_7794 [Streptomyces sp. TLI_053]